MKQFKMRGYAITNAVRFGEFFSPADLLWNRELAAGFLNQHFGNYSLVSRFHADMFWNCTFSKRKHDFCLKDALGYNSHIYGNINLENREKRLVRDYLDEKMDPKLLPALWDLSVQTELDEADRCILFCLLTAGYSLANKRLEQVPITPEEARMAYLKQTPQQFLEDGWFRFPDSGEIRLEASEKPYRILMKEGAAELLRAGVPIIPRKLVAIANAQGNNDLPVTLELFSSSDDPTPIRVSFYRNDYRYMNFVGSIPVYFQKVCRETDLFRMERRGSSLRCMDKTKDRLVLDGNNLCLDILGFDLETHTPGWILLTEKGLDDSGYTLRQNVPVVKKDIVQVQFRDMEVLLLDRYGTVWSGIHSIGSGVISLEDF